MERRFQPLKVPEPSVDDAIQILKGLRELYELHHKVRYTDDALIAAAELSCQYIRFVAFNFNLLNYGLHVAFINLSEEKMGIQSCFVIFKFETECIIRTHSPLPSTQTKPPA